MRELRVEASTEASTAGRAELDLDGLGEPWTTLLRSHLNGRRLRPVQCAAVEAGLLDSRRNLVVSAPTNGGKSLVGHLAMLDASLRGGRALLLAPLRVLAQEQRASLERLVGLLPAATPRPSTVITTGDYRLEHEHFDAPNPTVGDLIVATPERFDAILRLRGAASWVDSINTVVVDEAHLLGDGRRGATLEAVIATLQALSAPPRILLLSATIGSPERLCRWLEPADLVEVHERVPPLELAVVDAETTPRDEAVLTLVAEALDRADSCVVVFVFRRADAEKLAGRLAQDGATRGGEAAAFHSGMSLAARDEVRQRVMVGTVRCVVTTSALAMGVNLPCTHVLVRDTTFFGSGPLPVDRLLQMLGRAGRGDQSGKGVVLLADGDPWRPDVLVSALRNRKLEPIRSSLLAAPGRGWRARDGGEAALVATTARLVAGAIERQGDEGASLTVLERFAGATLAGDELVGAVAPALGWLTDSSRVLAWRGDDLRFRLTALGSRALRSSLPLGYASGVGQLFRDLMELGAEPTSYLRRWSLLDHLLLMELLSERSPGLRRFSEPLAEQIDGWMERQPGGAPLLWTWLGGAKGASRADELFGSLGISDGRTSPERARKRGYSTALRAVVMLERSRGVSPKDLARRWRVTGLEGVEEQWRDSAIWMLGGQSRLMDLRCFYYHLREDCGGGAEQVRTAKREFRRLRGQVWDLVEGIKYCSPLGPMVRGIRGMLKGTKGPVVGPVTIKRLEDSGVRSLKDVAQMDLEQLVVMGVRRDLAKQIVRYCRRRTR